MEETNFLHVDTDSQKLKADQKFIGRNKLIFCMLVQIQES